MARALTLREEHRLRVLRRIFGIREERAGGWGKLKVKLSLRLTKHHAMKAYWGRGGIAPLIL
jgi:hypothetical protein